MHRPDEPIFSPNMRLAQSSHMVDIPHALAFRRFWSSDLYCHGEGSATSPIMVCTPALRMWLPTGLGLYIVGRHVLGLQVRQTHSVGCCCQHGVVGRFRSVDLRYIYLMTVWDVVIIWRCSFVSDLRSSQRCRTSDFVRTSSVNKEINNGDRVTQWDNRFVLCKTAWF